MSVPVHTRFTLAVVISADGFIARFSGDAPQNWASAEEQTLFFDAVNSADWSIMGRGTHQAADRPDRRRIVFSSGGGRGQWRRPAQLWIDPAAHRPSDLAAMVSAVHPLAAGLILGGTRVHDWFLAARAIDVVHLSVEPVNFGHGLPVFTGQTSRDPVRVFTDAGFRVVSETVLNPGGTTALTMIPEAREIAANHAVERSRMLDHLQNADDK